MASLPRMGAEDRGIVQAGREGERWGTLMTEDVERQVGEGRSSEADSGCMMGSCQGE